MPDHTKIAVDAFDKWAREYQDRYMYLDLYNDTYDQFCDSLQKQGAEVLEIACGPGNITQYLLKKRPDLDILGTDLAPNMLELAQQNNPNARFQLMDGRAVAAAGQLYDAILCGFFLPYLSREEAIRFIQDAANQLRPNGLLYLSTMEDDYGKSGFVRSANTGDSIYIHYHEAGYLIEAISAVGLNIIDTWRKDFPQQDGSTTTDLILLARKPA